MSAGDAGRPVLRRVLAGSAAFGVAAGFAVRIRDVRRFAVAEPVALGAVFAVEALRAVDLAGVDFAAVDFAGVGAEAVDSAAVDFDVAGSAAVDFVVADFAVPRLAVVPDELDSADFARADSAPEASAPTAPEESRELVPCLVVRLPLPDFGEF